MSKIAIIETGGKQYVVAADSVITVEKLEAKKGDVVIFDKVLLVDDGATAQVGAPYVEGATVSGELIEEGRHKKVISMRYRPKSRYATKRGHRQHFAKVRVTKLP